jgi:hypothetical protein
MFVKGTASIGAREPAHTVAMEEDPLIPYIATTLTV